MNLKLLPILVFFFFTSIASAQKTWFIDGYHGGAYGHYPKTFTSFIDSQLRQHPDWKINIELEPETWDSVKTWEPEAYKEFAKWMSDTSQQQRIEYVSPAYGQSYLFNISGESIIRQFEYGMKKVRQHFPSTQFLTYSSEEPCFTSCLPAVLTSFGYKYASLKNPNTCWGGYTRAYGGETVNWIGPDGSSLRTVPRYATEKLFKESTWQTEAWTNSPAYFSAAKESGIQNPLAMCLQDAGWTNGPWLGKNAKETQYTTWRNYFENVAAPTILDWHFSQEDVLVGLVWGSQALQRTAQKVRRAETRLVMAEKLAAIAGVYQKLSWPAELVDEAWRNLMLAQHHDCWIVPLAWAERVSKWIAKAEQCTDSILSLALLHHGSTGELVVYNAAGKTRKGLFTLPLPAAASKYYLSITQDNSRRIPATISVNDSTGKPEVCFFAEVPPTGFASFSISHGSQQLYPVSMDRFGMKASSIRKGGAVIESDLYRIRIGGDGIIQSLYSKVDKTEYVASGGSRQFNQLNGFFYHLNSMKSGQDQPVSVKVRQHNHYRVSATISGRIGEHPYVQTITLTQGRKRIDLDIKIDWQKNEGIGDPYAQGKNYDAKDYRKAFYVDTAKLSLSFPLKLENQKIFKDAPFDVTESKLGNTFYNSWDSIKNTVIYRWIDVVDSVAGQGIALFSDHTTSYSHGKDFPLSLTLAYSGNALWSSGYKLEGTTNVKYALLPHRGKWDEADLNAEADDWQEPLTGLRYVSTGLYDTAHARRLVQMNRSESLLSLEGTGYGLSALKFSGDTLTIRLYNASGTAELSKFRIKGSATAANWIGLNGSKLEPAVFTNGIVSATIPRFGFRTLELTGFNVQ